MTNNPEYPVLQRYSERPRLILPRVHAVSAPRIAVMSRHSLQQHQLTIRVSCCV